MSRESVFYLMLTTRNPHEIALKVGIPASEVRQIMVDNPSDLQGWGKPHLQQHIISRRKGWGGSTEWPAIDSQILLDHRRLHDQGRATMCQGRDAEWIIQYAVLHTKPIFRHPYFYGGSTC